MINMFNENYTTPDWVDQVEEQEINYGYTRRRNETELKTFGFCPTCNKRITQLDDLYVYDFDVYCSERCISKFLEESA